MTPVLAGLIAGTAAALLGGSVVQSLLYETKAFDPLTFALVVGIVAAVAALGCFIPARRAMRVDPMVALRYE
jgi:ABC-type antimicrobial peptide transport system permease subunit